MAGESMPPNVRQERPNGKARGQRKFFWRESVIFIGRVCRSRPKGFCPPASAPQTPPIRRSGNPDRFTATFRTGLQERDKDSPPATAPWRCRPTLKWSGQRDHARGAASSSAATPGTPEHKKR